MKNNKAFTMIELLGVIVIIGFLSTMAVTAVSRYKKKAQNDTYKIMNKIWKVPLKTI